MKKIERKINLDILRFIGLLCIILAHVNPPKILFQIRNFDVILMAMLSIYLYLSFNKTENLIHYFFKRFTRLVLPTWIFLMIFFILNLVLKFNVYDLKIILSSFLLKDGIGYVWIIRIYLIIALLLPIFSYLINKYNKKSIFFITLVIYVLYEYLCYLGFFNNSIMQYLFAYIIPCFLIINITNHVMNLDNKKLLKFIFMLLIIFMISIILIYYFTGEFKQTQYMKYPFRFYYLEYSFLVSCILILLFRNNRLTNFCYNKIIKFVSENSLWIYLWHILFLQIFKFDSWLINYILTLSFSLIVTFTQFKIIKELEKKEVNKHILNIFKG